jgi:glycosyltransferase involved in cell wall biosynthesis
VLFDPHDPSSIAQGLGRLLALPVDSMTQMRRDARAFAEREFSIRRLAEQYLALLHRRIGPAGAS